MAFSPSSPTAEQLRIIAQDGLAMTERKSARRGFSTRAIHHAYDPYSGHGALNPPVYLSSTYTFPTVEAGAARFAGEQAGYVYSRVGNPTTALLEQRIADLEGGEAALVTASGMGATTSLLWTLLQPGDEVIADKTLYGCTFGFFNHGLARFGVRITHVDLTVPANLEPAISAGTKVVFFESPANPNMRLVDIAAISDIARRFAAKVVVDNTYCTPYLQRPIELGADYVVHSATKYLGGHGDLIAGAIVGPQELLTQVRFYGNGSVRNGAEILEAGVNEVVELEPPQPPPTRVHSRRGFNARCSSAVSLKWRRSSPVHTVGRSSPISRPILPATRRLSQVMILSCAPSWRSSTMASSAPDFGGSSSSRKPMKVIRCSSSLLMTGSLVTSRTAMPIIRPSHAMYPAIAASFASMAPQCAQQRRERRMTPADEALFLYLRHLQSETSRGIDSKFYRRGMIHAH